MRTSVIVPAAGNGLRFGAEIKKQYVPLEGRPLVCSCLQVFEDCKDADDIVLAVPNEDITYCEENIVRAYGFSKVCAVTGGGAERYHSVFEGLKILKNMKGKEPDFVMVHDGVRPFVTEDILERMLDAVKKYDAAICAIPVRDTIKQVDENGFVKTTYDRNSLCAVQTPQAFRFSLLYEAYEKLLSGDETLTAGITDDAMVIERIFPEQRIYVVRGDEKNIKITVKGDLK